MSEFLPGDMLGSRYEIIEQVGNGGMAEVYKAKCHKLNRFVAIKVLKPEFRSDPEFVESFNIESQATASLSHKNIVSVYDVGKDNELSYIVMEYVDGITLKQYIDTNKPLSWQESMDFSIQICSALEHAHTHHVIHKDIKPQNIMVTGNKVLKVMDFGIAQAASSSTVKLSESTMGSVHYLSPEQARGGYVDEKTDLYSLGVVMYEMLTGKVPFEASTPVSVALMHVESTAVPVTEVNPNVPDVVGNIVAKAMCKEQANRYQSATEMLTDLKAVKNREESLNNVAPVNFQDNNNSPTMRMAPVTPNRGGSVDTQPMTNTKNKKPKKPLTKSDKIAIVAALLTAILVLVGVFAFAWPKISQIFDGSGTEQKIISVPSVTGVDKVEAKLKVEDKNLKFSIDKEEFSDTVDKGKVISQDPAAGEKVAKNTTIKVVVSKGKGSDTMIDVVNMDRKAAVSQLEGMGFTVEVIDEEDPDYPSDTVIRSVPKSGEKMKSGDKITLYVNSANTDEGDTTTQTQKVSVPTLTGHTQEEAETLLKESKLKLGSVKKYYSDSVDAGYVIKQTISSGSEVAEGTSVSIYVSIGPKDGGSSAGDDEDSSGGSSSSGSKSVTKTVTVKVPQDRESTLITIKVDGDTVYNQTVSKDDANVSVSVSGKTGDTKKVSVYYDGELATSIDKSF